MNGLRSYVKRSIGCFIQYPNTLKLVKKKIGCASFFQPLLGVWISMKHSSSCLTLHQTSVVSYTSLIYYLVFKHAILL